jgi:hypothetical protein
MTISALIYRFDPAGGSTETLTVTWGIGSSARAMNVLAVPIIVATGMVAAAGLATPARADYWEPTPPTVPFS